MNALTLPIGIVGLSDRVHAADAFWRLVRPFARLREAGVDAQVCWLDRDEMPTLPVAGRVVVLQRVVVKGGNQDAVRRWVDRLRAAGALAVVFEMDDDVVSPAYMEYIDACGGLELVRRERLLEERQALEWAMQATDAVVVTTGPLAEVVRRYTPAPVHIVPNAIDVEWFRARLAPVPAWGEHLTIGWAGGRRPEADLEPMAVAWGRIARRYPDVRFVVAGWQPDAIYREIEDIDRIIRVPWQRLDDWPSTMAVTIGCTPLADTAFNRCKSPIKAWEYALAGAAIVTSRTVYGAALGLKAETADEWEHHLSLLIDEPEFRRSQAGAARWIAVSAHSLVMNLHRWADAYSEIAARVRVTV
ncbi:MAG: hypothetical protein AB7P40_00410 [Chloroflexota bacterium]